MPKVTVNNIQNINPNIGLENIDLPIYPFFYKINYFNNLYYNIKIIYFYLKFAKLIMLV